MSKKELKNLIIKKVKELNWKNWLLILVALAMGIYFRWSIGEIAVFCIFIYILLYPVPSRFMVMPALFFLILTPFFLIFSQESIAEQLAIYCYYFLVMTAIMGIYEIRKEEKIKNRLLNIKY